MRITFATQILAIGLDTKEESHLVAPWHVNCQIKVRGSELHGEIGEVRDDPKLLGDSGHGWRISEWSGWRFDSSCEIFSPLDGKELVR